MSAARRPLSARLLGRLSVTAIAAALLLVGLAYWWQGNLVHEIVGTLMFVLLVAHNVINRHWYGTVVRAWPDRRRLLTVASNLSLLSVMVVLLVTSVMISQSLFAFLPITAGFTVVELHILAAYWALVIFAVHLGLHWSIVMKAASNALRLKGPSPARTFALRAATIVIAATGIASSFAMGLGSKLINQVTLEMWDFQQAALQFFVNYGSIVGLYAAIAHYGQFLVRKRARARIDETAS